MHTIMLFALLVHSISSLSCLFILLRPPGRDSSLFSVLYYLAQLPAMPRSHSMLLNISDRGYNLILFHNTSNKKNKVATPHLSKGGGTVSGTERCNFLTLSCCHSSTADPISALGLPAAAYNAPLKR